MGKNTFEHLKVPPYQKNWIALSHGLVLDHTKELGVSFDNIFTTTQVKIWGILDSAGIYRIMEDFVEISIAFWLNIGVILHELIHAFSASYRHWFSPIEKIQTGFYLWSVKWKLANQADGFNEWMTEFITRKIYKKAEKQIVAFQKSYRDVQRRIDAVLRLNWKRVWTNDKYDAYKTEINFVQVFIDLITYERIKWQDRDFYEVRIQIERELEQEYFRWNLRWLKDTCKSIDNSWLLYRHIIDLDSVKSWVNTGMQTVLDWIVWHISGNFDRNYTPTKLQ